jgi:hypothetical protein
MKVEGRFNSPNVVHFNVVLQHPVAHHLLFLCYSPSHMQTCVKIVKFEFLSFRIIFTLPLHYMFRPIWSSSGATKLLLKLLHFRQQVQIQSITSSMDLCVAVRFMVMGLVVSCRVVCELTDESTAISIAISKHLVMTIPVETCSKTVM